MLDTPQSEMHFGSNRMAGRNGISEASQTLLTRRSKSQYRARLEVRRMGKELRENQIENNRNTSRFGRCFWQRGGVRGRGHSEFLDLIGGSLFGSL
jgi:hypothetical protein